MKEDKYIKSLAKNQVYAIVHMRDIRKNVLPKFIKLCMETPCLCPRGSGGVLHTLPIRVCAAQRGRDFEAPGLERGIHFKGVF